MLNLFLEREKKEKTDQMSYFPSTANQNSMQNKTYLNNSQCCEGKKLARG
jgi:hypothetical protein